MRQAEGHLSKDREPPKGHVIVSVGMATTADTSSFSGPGGELFRARGYDLVVRCADQCYDPNESGPNYAQLGAR